MVNLDQMIKAHWGTLTLVRVDLKPFQRWWAMADNSLGLNQWRTPDPVVDLKTFQIWTLMMDSTLSLGWTHFPLVGTSHWGQAKKPASSHPGGRVNEKLREYWEYILAQAISRCEAKEKILEEIWRGATYEDDAADSTRRDSSQEKGSISPSISSQVTRAWLIH